MAVALVKYAVIVVGLCTTLRTSSTHSGDEQEREYGRDRGDGFGSSGGPGGGPQVSLGWGIPL